MWRHLSRFPSPDRIPSRLPTRFSSSFVTRPLTFVLPDLTSTELTYVRSQLSLIRACGVESARNCKWHDADAIVRDEYRSFLCGSKTKPGDRLYRRLTQSPVLTRRIVRALKVFGVSEKEVRDNPDIVGYPLLSLPRDAQIQKHLDVPLLNVLKHRLTSPVRGMVIRDLLEDVTNTLDKLDMIDRDCSRHVVTFEGIGIKPKQRSTITYEQVNVKAVRALIGHLFPSEFVDEVMQVVRAHSKSASEVKSIVKDYKRIPSVNVKEFLRNYWLFSNLLKLDINNIKLTRAIFEICPLETLIVLNSFYEAITERNPDLNPDEFLSTFSQNCLHNLLQPSFKYPAGLRMEMLLEIGFSEKEAAEVMMSKIKSFSNCNSKANDRLRITNPDYITEMRRRLSILRPESTTLGIGTPSDLFLAMTHWNSVLENVKAIDQDQKHGHCLHFDGIRNKLSVTESYLHMGINPATKHLSTYFDCKTRSEIDSLLKDTFVFSNQNSIPFSRVLSCLNSLEQRGFSKVQLRKATPLLFYPHRLVEQKLDEMRQVDEYREDWAKDEILAICLYLIEKEVQFSCDCVWAGIKPELSNKLYKEMEDQLGYVSTNNQQKKKKPLVAKSSREEYGYHHDPVFAAGVNQIRSFSTSCTNNMDGFKVLKLVNPIKAIQISEEFRKLRLEWDGSIEKDSFLEASKQAIATVTELLQASDYVGLSGLLTRKELDRWREELELRWDDVHRNNLALQVDEIALAVPTRVLRHYVAYERHCDIDVTFTALRNVNSSSYPVVPMTISATFHRDYTEGRLPDWVINKLHIEIMQIGPKK